MDEPQEQEQVVKKSGQCCPCQDVLSVLKPPCGSAATMALWLGLMLIIASFGVKQIFFNWTILGVNTLIEAEKMNMEEQLDKTDLDDDSYKVEGFEEKYSVREIDDKIDLLERDGTQAKEKVNAKFDYEELKVRREFGPQIKAAEAKSDWNKRNEVQGKMDEKVKKLQEERNKEIQALGNNDVDNNYEDDRAENLRAQKRFVKVQQIEDKNEIEDDYREKKYDARVDQMAQGVDTMGNVQWGLWLKFLLDMLKVFGSILVILAALQISADPEAATTLKIYALICGSITLFSCLCLGFLTMLS